MATRSELSARGSSVSGCILRGSVWIYSLYTPLVRRIVYRHIHGRHLAQDFGLVISAAFIKYLDGSAAWVAATILNEANCIEEVWTKHDWTQWKWR
jgi:hypothetical protein